MKGKIRNFLPFVFILVLSGCDSCEQQNPVSPSATSIADGKANSGNPTQETKNPTSGLTANELPVIPMPTRIDGVETASLRGWFAAIYPWNYVPEQSLIRPIPELFTPHQSQNPGQVAFQNRLLDSYGSSADVLSFNAGSSIDLNHWSGTYFSNGSRPFFLLWEHLLPNNGPKNMDDLSNRAAFMAELRFMFENVILPYQYRYVTVDGRAVIYMWASGNMIGNFASLLDEARNKYPVFFVGSGEDYGNIERVKAFDGIMEYTLAGYGADYTSMTREYHNRSVFWRGVLDSIRSQTGKKIYFFATFQAAYDDTLVSPRRNSTISLYPRTSQEMEEHARLVSLGIKRWRVYDAGPLVIFSEIPEGGSVIPSISQPETDGRYVGFGTGRIDVVRKYFGSRR